MLSIACWLAKLFSEKSRGLPGVAISSQGLVDWLIGIHNRAFEDYYLI
jgi:hypothetical protein